MQWMSSSSIASTLPSTVSTRMRRRKPGIFSILALFASTGLPRIRTGRNASTAPRGRLGTRLRATGRRERHRHGDPAPGSRPVERLDGDAKMRQSASAGNGITEVHQ